MYFRNVPERDEFIEILPEILQKKFQSFILFNQFKRKNDCFVSNFFQPAAGGFARPYTQIMNFFPHP